MVAAKMAAVKVAAAAVAVVVAAAVVVAEHQVVAAPARFGRGGGQDTSETSSHSFWHTCGVSSGNV